MKLRLLSRANNEIDVAARFYLEEADEWIADRFLDEIKSTSANIADDPNRNRLYNENVRVARLSTFPYSIYYRIKSNEIVVVVVSHNSRRPGYWRNRM